MPCARKNRLLHSFPFLTPLRLYFEMLFGTTSIIKVSSYFLVSSHVQLKPCHYYSSNWLQLSLVFSQVFGIFAHSPVMSPYFNLPVQVSSFSYIFRFFRNKVKHHLRIFFIPSLELVYYVLTFSFARFGVCHLTILFQNYIQLLSFSFSCCLTSIV